MIILRRGKTRLKKLSWSNSRQLSFFPISNFTTQNSPYQVKAKHRTNHTARKPLLDRDHGRNTEWVQTITQSMSLQVSNTFQSLDTLESPWIEMCCTRPWHRASALRDKSPSLLVRELYSPGTANPVDVLAQGEQELLPVDRPHFDRFVIRSCNQGLAIAGEMNAPHGCCVSLEHSGFSFPTQKGGAL